MIRQSNLTVALSGAGISTAAGIPDFRGPGGIYESGRYDAERVFDIQAFRADPREFFRFTRDLADAVKNLEPTFTHRLLARMEARGLLEAVITQNIDPLHHLAGSKNIIALHGDYAVSHCQSCGRRYDFGQLLALLDEMEVPRCDCAAGGVIKPDVVFFGENVKGMDVAGELASACDLMLVLGSSLVVYPAALLPQMARADVVVVNLAEPALPAASNRYFVRQDLDEFFGAVAEQLDI